MVNYHRLVYNVLEKKTINQYKFYSDPRSTIEFFLKNNRKKGLVDDEGHKDGD